MQSFMILAGALGLLLFQSVLLYLQVNKV